METMIHSLARCPQQKGLGVNKRGWEAVGMVVQAGMILSLGSHEHLGLPAGK